MSQALVQRYYPISDLSFRDFWDICSRFQTLNPEYSRVDYTVEAEDAFIVLEEPEVSKILKKLPATEDQLRKFSARFYTSQTQQGTGYGVSEMQYRPRPMDRFKQGLSFYGDTVFKSSFYQFEEDIRANFPFVEENELEMEFGKPCEVLALVIDLRGFSDFCEKPEIESPYTCGLMSAFYNMTNHALQRFPPDMTKFMGDGVLAIWETNPSDREITVRVALEAALNLHNSWAAVKDNPHFTHGAPQDIGAGICFGLASHLEIGDDYLGRPINIASRLCGACPGNLVYVDRAVPNLPVELRKQEYVAHIKSYGRHNVWAYPTRLGDRTDQSSTR